MSLQRTAPSVGAQNASTAPSATFQPTSAAGVLLSVLVDNSGGAQYLQFWNATGLTDASAVQLWGTGVPAGGYVALDTPIRFSRGIFLRLSSARRSTQGEFSAGTNLGSASGEWITRHI